jgi:drug/metabolite transporter (DMT)-like permease
MPHHRRAVFFLLLTAVLWSLGGLLIKSIAWPAPAIAGGRSAMAAVVLLAVVRPRNLSWSFAQVGGAVSYAATVTLFVFANKLTTAANAILLQYTAPLWIALFSPWFLAERAGRLDWPIMLLILAGVTLFFLDELTVAGFWGNVLALVSGLSFGWVAMFLRKQKSASPFESVFLGNVLTAVCCLPFGSWSAPNANGSVFLGWALLAALGVFQLGCAYLLYASALRHVTALEAMLIPAVEPILNPVLVLLALGERPGPRALAGGALVLGAVTLKAVLSIRHVGLERACSLK